MRFQDIKDYFEEKLEHAASEVLAESTYAVISALITFEREWGLDFEEEATKPERFAYGVMQTSRAYVENHLGVGDKVPKTALVAELADVLDTNITEAKCVILRLFAEGLLTAHIDGERQVWMVRAV